ncbi:TM0106 family RecB-like putative nuclease [Bradyrhizobium sp. DN5]|uniref:TM0106 family RecB-like putative nuclease n=1 Tax=Bradyrhizobium sp. DN5 TaxID=3056950 RepID=UPI0035255299
MRVQGQQVLLSASDLMRFMSCKHATALDLRFARGEDLVPTEDSEDAQLLQKYGDDHELRYLSALKADGQKVLELNRDSDLATAANKTREALATGPDVVFQGALLSLPWGGWSDFLIRVERPSALGSFSYEVVDTKLKRKPDPKHILQLVLYSDLLSEIQHLEPEHAHVELGNGKRFSFRLNEYAAYSRYARQRLEQFVVAPPTTTPDPVKMCGLCRWRDTCEKFWNETDSLSLVAGISRSQRGKLLASGVTTMTQLGQLSQRIPKLAEATLQKLAAQARLQTLRRAGGPPSFELKPFDPNRGLALLPKPDPGDVFYDIEGDPYFEGGLEYLHGLWFQDGGNGVFRDFWAHDRAAEGESLRKLMTFFADRLEEYPGAHIYHYAAYEISALRRLTCSHGVGEALLDQMLRDHRFVDLYTVVSGSLIASEPAYSLKNLEVFYMEARSGEVKTAGASVVAYENWRDSRDPKILREIRDYNRDDCISTQKLRDWLVSSVRPADMQWAPLGGPNGKGDGRRNSVHDDEAAVAALRKKLVPVHDRYGEGIADLLFDLSCFHTREKKPAWWAIFDKMSKELDDLIEDAECLGGLVAKTRTIDAGRSWERTYDFPDQESKLKPGDCHIEVDGLPVSVNLINLNYARRTATVRFSQSRFREAPKFISLLPGRPLDTDAIEGAIERGVDSFIRGNGRYPAIRDFITRSSPRFTNARRLKAVVDAGKMFVSEVVSAVAELDCSVLPIQGPPGTGKTYVSSCAILELVRRGKRIAVASHSHNAIDNLLYAVLDRAAETGTTVSMAKKGGGDFDARYGDLIHQTERNEDARLLSASVVGGTAWLFSRVDFEASFDYLFVDEAGQVSIANTVAMATCAKNVVLVGDPMQLSQPIQGAHPGESGQSALEYLLSGHNTVPVDRGIFLPTSRRMHPDICRIISDFVYEGRLNSDEGAAQQCIIGETYPLRTGARLIEVPHAGNTQSSHEEIAAIRIELQRLLACKFRDRAGHESRLSLDDVLIVAPYNLQVNALKAALPSGARVGTIDKFQGQEAPVCLISMTTSSGDEIPRGVDFLFSINRINVAISRAQALSLIFASPRLLEVACNTVEDMRLVNSLCALRELDSETRVVR